MRDFKQSKLLTVVCVFGFTLALSFKVWGGETATGSDNNHSSVQAALSDTQHKRELCAGLEDKVAEADKKFQSSCVEADLGSSTACRKLLLECRLEGGKNNPKCLNKAPSSDDLKMARERVEDMHKQKDKVQEKIEKLEEDKKEQEQKSFAMLKSHDSIKQQLQVTLKSIENKKQVALSQRNSELEKADMEVEKLSDKIYDESMKLRQMVVDNEIECRKTANQVRYNFIAKMNADARSEQSAKYRFSDLNKMHGTSIKQLATAKADRHLRVCLSLYRNTKRGMRRTSFGTQYRLQHAIVKENQRRLQRSIVRVQRARQRVEQEFKRTVKNLEWNKRAAVQKAQTDRLRLSQEASYLKQLKAQTAYKLAQTQTELMLEHSKLVQAEYQQNMIYTRKANNTDKKKKAFVEAQKGLSEREIAVERYKSESDLCRAKESSYIRNIAGEDKDKSKP